MSLTVKVIAKLSGVDCSIARRALETAAAFEKPGAIAPEEFTTGPGARCFALASIVNCRPLLFWGGITALIALPFICVVSLLRDG